jgi:hypothetical protein
MSIEEVDQQIERLEQQPLHSLAVPKDVDQSRRDFTKASLAVSGLILTLASRSALAGGGGGGGTCKTPSAFCSANVSQHGTPHSGGGHSCQHWIDNCRSWVNCDRTKPFSSHFSCGTGSHWGDNVVHSWESSYSSWGYKSSSGSSYGGSSSGSSYSRDGRGSYVPYTLLDILCRHHVGYSPSGTNSPCTVTKNSSGRAVNNWYSSSTPPSVSTYKEIPCPPGTIDELGQHCVKALLNYRAGLTPFCTESTVKAIFNECSSKGYFQPTAGVKWTVAQCVDYLKSTERCTYYS